MLVLALRKSIDSSNCGAFEFLFLCALSRYIFPARSPAALSLAFYIFLLLFLQSWGVCVCVLFGHGSWTAARQILQFAKVNSSASSWVSQFFRETSAAAKFNCGAQQVINVSGG
jgi:hypothetical protein